MNKNLIPLVGIILATLISGCAKNNDNKNIDQTVNQQNQQPKAVDLSGKSLEEVLALKYNKAELACAMWVQRNQKLDLTTTPNDFFVLDLKANSKMPQTFKLAGQVHNHKIEAQVEINSLAMWGSLNHTDAEGNVYVAQYSPYADYVLTYKSATTFENGLVSSGDSYFKRQVNEKIIDMALNEAHDSQPAEQNGVVINYGAYRNYVQCVINTEIKPEYQNQFKVQSRNP